jgi:uncharacterized protein YktB (UPF0637 family)
VACVTFESYYIPPKLFIGFNVFLARLEIKNLQKGFVMVWHSTFRLMWKARNDKIFNNIIKNSKELVDEIKVLSWKWSVHHMKPCLFSVQVLHNSNFNLNFNK